MTRFDPSVVGKRDTDGRFAVTALARLSVVFPASKSRNGIVVTAFVGKCSNSRLMDPVVTATAPSRRARLVFECGRHRTSEDAFRFVQRMQAEHRVIPLVGDFAGSKALPGVASYLRENKIRFSLFYVSNVEEFLFEDKVWPKWVENVFALPSDDQSLFTPTWMNHHPRHPKQLPGQRTTILVQWFRRVGVRFPEGLVAVQMILRNGFFLYGDCFSLTRSWFKKF